MARTDGRTSGQLRPVGFTRGWLDHAEGSVLVEFSRTRVLCAASVTQGVPRWRKGSGLGWVTAEYAMLPRSTNTRSDRESVKGRIGGREDFIAGYRSGQTVRVLAFDDLVVDVYGDAAVVRGVQTVERVSDGLPVRRIARYTRFYVRFPGGWQAVAAHASPLPPPAAK